MDLENAPNKSYKCKTMGCKAKAQYFCADHQNQTLCNGCVTFMHATCKAEEFKDTKQVWERTMIIIAMVNEIEKYANAFNLSACINDFNQKLEETNQSIQRFKEKVQKTIDEDAYWLYNVLFKEAIELKYNIDEGPLFQQYAMFKAKRDMMNKIYSLQDNLSMDDADFVDKLHKFKKDFIEQTEKAKVEEIQKMRQDIEESFNQRYSDRLIRLESELNEAQKDLDRQIEDCKLKDYRIEQLEIEKENCGKIIQKYLNKILDTDSKYDKDFKLQLTFDNKKHKELFKMVGLSKLPDIKRIYLDYLKNNDESTKNFFLKSFPNNLKLLCLNYYNSERIYMKYYHVPLIKCLGKVSKEIYLENFYMDQDEFSSIIRASKYCDKVIIRSTKIGRSGTIDLGKDLNYNIKLVSFEYTGHSTNSDWAKNKEQFRNIIRCIKESGLSLSLNTLSLYECGVNIHDVNLEGVDINTSWYNPTQN